MIHVFSYQVRNNSRYIVLNEKMKFLKGSDFSTFENLEEIVELFINNINEPRNSSCWTDSQEAAYFLDNYNSEKVLEVEDAEAFSKLKETNPEYFI